MRIAIIYNEIDCTPGTEDWLTRSNGRRDPAKADIHEEAEFGLLRELEFIQSSLAQAGHEPVIFGADDSAKLCRFLTKYRPEMVFNCCDAFAGNAALEMNVAALYEMFDAPYTGSSPLTLGLLLNKPLAKAVLTAHGIKTPAYVVVDRGQSPLAARHLTFPLIVKPAAEDASIGIDDGAVVHDESALAKRVRFVWREFGQAALVEEFIDGREFNASVLAVSPGKFVTLAIGEIAYDMLPAGRPQIFGYEAKWDPTAPFNHAMATRCPAVIDKITARRIQRLATEVAQVVGLRDYGRIDLRIRNSDQALFVLEVNPNPDLDLECSFMRAARSSGRTDQGTICEIVERASERCDLERAKRQVAE